MGNLRKFSVESDSLEVPEPLQASIGASTVTVRALVYKEEERARAAAMKAYKETYPEQDRVKTPKSDDDGESAKPERKEKMSDADQLRSKALHPPYVAAVGIHTVDGEAVTSTDEERLEWGESLISGAVTWLAVQVAKVSRIIDDDESMGNDSGGSTSQTA